jgi:hypothetical protein
MRYDKVKRISTKTVSYVDIFNVFHAVLTVYFVSAISLLSPRENSMGRKYDLVFPSSHGRTTALMDFPVVGTNEIDNHLY